MEISIRAKSEVTNPVSEFCQIYRRVSISRSFIVLILEINQYFLVNDKRMFNFLGNSREINITPINHETFSETLTRSFKV